MNRPQVKTDLPKKKDRSATEAKLLEAGIEVFSKCGFEGATSDMIAKKAETNVSLINRYFGSKEGLLLTIAEKFRDTAQATVLPYPSQDDIESELVCYAQQKTEELLRDRDLIRIIISRAAVDETFRTQMRERLTSRGDPRLLMRLSQLQTAGLIRADIEVDVVGMVVVSHFFSTTFVMNMIFEASAEEVLCSLRQFVSCYAQGLKPKLN